MAKGIESFITNGASGSGGGIASINGNTNSAQTIVAGSGVTVGSVGGVTTITASAGGGNVTGPASSVDSQVAVFNGTTGQLLKAASGSGVAILTSGVLSVASVLPVASGGTNSSATLTSGKVMISTAGAIVESTVTSATLAFLDATSSVQTQLNGKQASGTYVTTISVASANGFAGSSSGGATPALTLSTSITGLLKGNGTAISAASSGTDYSAGTSALATGILKSTTTTGVLSIAIAADFPTLNQNTTGTAANITGTTNSTLTTISTLVSVGTITTGTWSATTIAANKGGTGVANNAANTITFTGAFALGLTLTAGTSVTLPTSGTLATLANAEVLTNKTVVRSSNTISQFDSASAVDNGTIACSVATNALTIALKDISGADASATSKVFIGFKNVTPATGTFLTRTVSAALSVVVPSTGTLGHLSAVNQYIYVYALDNAGTVELAVSSIRLDEGVLQSSTAIAGSPTSRSTLYSTTARTSVPIRLIAVLTSNQTTAGTWAAVPTNVSLFPTFVKPLDSEIIVSTPTATGSTNLAISVFSTVQKAGAGAVTYASSATLGDTFTIQEPGLYSVYIVMRGAANDFIGVSLNSSQLSTSIGGINVADIVCVKNTTLSGYDEPVSRTARFAVGDVLRVHCGGSTATNTSSPFNRIVICKVAEG